MIFIPTQLPGASIIELEPQPDERGYFCRTFCVHEFEANGLAADMVQASISLTHRAGTLRGLHYQLAPYSEDKLVRCARGAIWDAIVDIRPQSPTYCKWLGLELSESNNRMLFVPKGFAHGFVALTDNAVVHYQISQFYMPAAARGARHDDPAFAIEWPVPVLEMSQRDRSWPDFATQRAAHDLA